MEIRLARRDDAEEIRAIYNPAVLDSTATFDLRPRSLDDQRRWLDEHAGAHAAIVAVEGDTVLGFGSLSPYRTRPAYVTSVEDSVYVHRDHHGKGVGGVLLAELIRLANAHGFHAVFARIVGGHEASIALHRRVGFEIIGTEREVGRKFGRWLDVVVMQLIVSNPDGEPSPSPRPPIVGGPDAHRPGAS